MPISHTGRRRLKLILLAIVGIIIIAFLFGGDGLVSSIFLNHRIARLEARIDSLAAVNERMKEKIEGLKKGDLEVLEEEARSHGMVKPGEKVYLMKDEAERKRK